MSVLTMAYAFPNTEGAVVNFKDKYDNYIGGKWTPPVGGQYFENVTPVTGRCLQKLRVQLRKMLN